MDGLMIPIMAGVRVLAEATGPITQSEASKEGTSFIICLILGFQLTILTLCVLNHSTLGDLKKYYHPKR